MSDYYIGLVVGGLVGYLGALITMIMMWALCVAAHDERLERGEDGKNLCALQGRESSM
jgi:hypothetical protein